LNLPVPIPLVFAVFALPGAGVAADGAALYAEHCALCHGAALEGAPDWQSPGPDGIYPAPPHDATGHTWHHGDALLFDYVRRGGAAVLADAGVAGFNSGMPAFGDTLDDDDIRAVIDYIKSTWPEPIRAIQRDRTQAEAIDGKAP
jgi:mono/diheme cytochrome c family protein